MSNAPAVTKPRGSCMGSLLGSRHPLSLGVTCGSRPWVGGSNPVNTWFLEFYFLQQAGLQRRWAWRSSTHPRDQGLLPSQPCLCMQLWLIVPKSRWDRSHWQGSASHRSFGRRLEGRLHSHRLWLWVPHLKYDFAFLMTAVPWSLCAWRWGQAQAYQRMIRTLR